MLVRTRNEACIQQRRKQGRVLISGSKRYQIVLYDKYYYYCTTATTTTTTTVLLPPYLDGVTNILEGSGAGSCCLIIILIRKRRGHLRVVYLCLESGHGVNYSEFEDPRHLMYCMLYICVYHGMQFLRVYLSTPIHDRLLFCLINCFKRCSYKRTLYIILW